MYRAVVYTASVGLKQTVIFESTELGDRFLIIFIIIMIQIILCQLFVSIFFSISQTAG